MLIMNLAAGRTLPTNEPRWPVPNHQPTTRHLTQAATNDLLRILYQSSSQALSAGERLLEGVSDPGFLGETTPFPRLRGKLSGLVGTTLKALPCAP